MSSSQQTSTSPCRHPHVHRGRLDRRHVSSTASYDPCLVESAGHSAAPRTHFRRRASSGRGRRVALRSGDFRRGHSPAAVGDYLRPRAVSDLRLPAALACPTCRLLASLGSGGGGDRCRTSSGGFSYDAGPEDLPDSHLVVSFSFPLTCFCATLPLDDFGTTERSYRVVRA